MNRSTNFNFYLPQNTDQVDVSQFDYNFEIIDEQLAPAVNGVADIRSAKNLGSFSTSAQLAGLLDTELAAMGNSTGRFIRVTASATADWFVNTYYYYGVLFKGYGVDYTHAMLYSNASPDVITAYRVSGTGWTFARMPQLTDMSSGVLPSGANLNSYRSETSYLLDGNSSYTNAPDTYGILRIFSPAPSYCVQFVYTATNAYWRYYAAGTWYGWRKITNTAL